VIRLVKLAIAVLYPILYDPSFVAHPDDTSVGVQPNPHIMSKATQDAAKSQVVQSNHISLV
jgi:hypothetical protein